MTSGSRKESKVVNCSVALHAMGTAWFTQSDACKNMIYVDPKDSFLLLFCSRLNSSRYRHLQHRTLRWSQSLTSVCCEQLANNMLLVVAYLNGCGRQKHFILNAVHQTIRLKS